MHKKTHSTRYRLLLNALLLIQCCILALYFAGNGWRSIGVPAGLIICVILVAIRIRKESARRHTISSTPAVMDEPLIQQAQKRVEEGMATIDLAVIGTEYRRGKRREFEQTIDAIIDKCIKMVRSHIDCNTVAVFFPTNDGGFKIRRYHSPGDLVNQDAVIYPGVGVIGSFLKNGLKQLKLTDIVTDSMTLYYYKKDAGIRSLMASPIMADKVERGVIIVDSTEKDHFTDENHAYLSVMAELMGQIIYNSYLYNQHKLDHERLVAMSSTEKYFFQEQHIDGVLNKLEEIIPFAFHCDRLTISLFDDSSEKAEIKRVWGEEPDGLTGLGFTISEKSIANIVYSKHLCIFRNFSAEHYEIRYTPQEPQSGLFQSFLAFPLGVDKCKGMILLESRFPNTYTESNRDLLSRLVSSAAITIEKIHILQQTENLAIRDGLTGLYNHRQFQHLLKEAITRSLRTKKPLALAICDIDHFKKVNDNYGHRFGDTVLKAVAVKLQSSIHEGIDNAARYGGEEFALILAETDARQAMDTVDRLRQSIATTPFQNPQGNEMHVTLSFGIAVYGIHAKNQEHLINRADKALYKAKENGRNRVELYYTTEEHGPETEKQANKPSTG